VTLPCSATSRPASVTPTGDGVDEQDKALCAVIQKLAQGGHLTQADFDALEVAAPDGSQALAFPTERLPEPAMTTLPLEATLRARILEMAS